MHAWTRNCAAAGIIAVTLRRDLAKTVIFWTFLFLFVFVLFVFVAGKDARRV
jgi:hypothetical protein